MMVVLKKSFPLVVWFTSSVPIVSWKDKAKAIEVCVNRFDDETKQAFLQLYDKVDADFEMPVDNQEQN